jgi:hypothetical protein
MITDQYEFKYTSSDGRETVYKCAKNIMSWHDLIPEFHNFLKGQGFLFDDDKIFVLKKGKYEY